MGRTLSLAERIRAVATLDLDADAIEFEGRWHPWRETQTAIDQLTGLLAEAGLGAGAPVGLLLRNRPHHVQGLAAVLANECSVVTMNARQPKERIRAEVRDMNLPVLMADSEDWQDAELREIVSEAGALGIEMQASGGLKAFTSIDPDRRFDDGDPSVAIKMLTSGTTGTPKRVIFGAQNLKDSVLGAARVMPGGSDRIQGEEPELLLRRGIILSWFPMVHVSGMWRCIEHVLQGRRLCLLESFDPKQWASAVRVHGVRMASLSPTALRMVLDAKIPKEEFASLRAVGSGTAPLSVEVKREFEETYDLPVLTAYGATEFPGNGAGWTLDDHEAFGRTKIGSVGRPRPGVRIRIVDESDGTEKAAGDVGLVEVLARSAATPDGQEPDWLRTTDLGSIDEDGFLWIVGRADSAIIRGGFKILATDVVQVLERHESVKEASVVGIDDDRLGSVPVAAIIPSSLEDPPSVEALNAYCREHLTAYQIPAEFRIVDDLPRTPSLKVSMPGVRALFEKRS